MLALLRLSEVSLQDLDQLHQASFQFTPVSVWSPLAQIKQSIRILFFACLRLIVSTARRGQSTILDKSGRRGWRNKSVSGLVYHEEHCCGQE
jgi:hypothetical protein